MMPDKRPQTKNAKPRVLLSVPLTPEQKMDLLRRAGTKPVSCYARDLLFAANDNPRPARIRSRKSREVMAATILAQLGKSDVASSLREIARGVQLGIIVVTPETDAALREAAANVNAAAKAALRALGINKR
jgi:hypothetical protein